MLTKRYNSRKQYSPASGKIFSKLIDLSMKPRKKSGRGRIALYKTPDEVVERLQLLTGSKQGGKVSKDIDNEIVTILDKLREEKVITKSNMRVFTVDG